MPISGSANNVYLYARPAGPLAAVVSIGIESIEDKKVDPVYSEDEPPVLLYNREATISLQFIIHIPQESSGLDCYDLVTRIGEALLDNSFSYDFEKLTAAKSATTANAAP